MISAQPTRVPTALLSLCLSVCVLWALLLAGFCQASNAQRLLGQAKVGGWVEGNQRREAGGGGGGRIS